METISQREESAMLSGRIGGRNILVAALLFCALPGFAAVDRPNIILFFTDDQGWTDTSVRMMAGRGDSRSDFYRTPALERLAREGPWRCSCWRGIFSGNIAEK